MGMRSKPFRLAHNARQVVIEGESYRQAQRRGGAMVMKTAVYQGETQPCYRLS